MHGNTDNENLYYNIILKTDYVAEIHNRYRQWYLYHSKQ